VSRRLAAVIVALATAVTACGPSSSGTGSSGPSSSGPGSSGVTVFAASSLVDAFPAVAAGYRKQHAGRVTFSFAGSQELVAQLQNGAPADVLATADATTMHGVAGRLTAPAAVFAHNRLVIVTAPGNPKHVSSLRDLARRGVSVVLADPSVPAGKYAAAALAAAQVTVHPVSLELEVRSVLTKVELRQADAGVVYVTDAAAARGKVDAVRVANSPVATYEIAPLDANGAAFVRYVLSAAGQAVLKRFGFLPK
jgi:molybdate transport system substrate-binding protein